MCYEIRRVKQGDADALGAVQTASWKAAFRGILSEEMLEKLTDPQKAAAMYRRLLADGTGNGYIGEIDGKATASPIGTRPGMPICPNMPRSSVFTACPTTGAKAMGDR